MPKYSILDLHACAWKQQFQQNHSDLKERFLYTLLDMYHILLFIKSIMSGVPCFFFPYLIHFLPYAMKLQGI